jgi:putative ABC transport system permease protein
MNTFTLSFKNLKAKPLNTVLNLLLFSTGIFMISLLLLLKSGFEEQMENNNGGIDLVVGAKGSPLQLILSSMYHVDYPTGNIKLDEAEKLSENPLIKKTIPMALGDNYQGFRIVGTNHDYLAQYKATIAKGVLWNKNQEVNIGAKVARTTGLGIGDKFAGVHGFIHEIGHVHDEFQYTVTGIFAETGNVIDQLILTNVGSVWEVHQHHDHSADEEADEDHHAKCSHQHETDEGHGHHEGCDHDHTEEHDHHEGCDHDHDHAHEKSSEKEITSLLVICHNAMGVINLPREINKNTNMQAAAPAFEINRLFSLMGIGLKTINLIAYILIIISGFSIFISLYSSMKERKYELALMRVLGGGKSKLFAIVVSEGLMIALGGYVIGFLLSRIGVLVVSNFAEASFHYSIQRFFDAQTDLMLLALSLLVGFLASFLPALKAMRTDISKTLAQ